MGSQRKEISVDSYAKINLFLEVLYKRKDGYHQLRTIFSELELHDTLNFALTENNKVEFSSNIELGDDTNNTVLKAINLLRNDFAIEDGVKVRLEKMIPLSAGLGGGSSNAAATLKALNEWWGLDLSLSELFDYGSRIGSDVNFFLVGGTALGEGRGEIISELNWIEFTNILLVKPDFGISSKDAYSKLSEHGNEESWKNLIRIGDASSCFNRLENGLLATYPELKTIITAMACEGLQISFVTGSGSTVVGIFSDEVSCINKYNLFKDKGYWCCKTKTKRRK
jgi:4-diphosphocytidyl-2-C-methyl-D-erythritol kinase